MGKDSLIRKQHTNIRYQSVRKGRPNLSTQRKILFQNPDNFQIRLHVQMEYMKKLIKNSILVITQRIKRESLFKKLSNQRQNELLNRQKL